MLYVVVNSPLQFSGVSLSEVCGVSSESRSNRSPAGLVVQGQTETASARCGNLPGVGASSSLVAFSSTLRIAKGVPKPAVLLHSR